MKSCPSLLPIITCSPLNQNCFSVMQSCICPSCRDVIFHIRISFVISKGVFQNIRSRREWCPTSPKQAHEIAEAMYCCRSDAARPCRCDAATRRVTMLRLHKVCCIFAFCAIALPLQRRVFHCPFRRIATTRQFVWAIRRLVSLRCYNSKQNTLWELPARRF